MHVQGILETSLYVDDLEAAEEFYRGVLQLEVHSEQENRHVFFRCGQGMLLIFNPLESCRQDDTEIPTHGSEGPGHVAFSIEPGTTDEWRLHLAERGVPIEREIEWPNGSLSIYFRDPAGNSLELACSSMWGS